MNISNIEEQSFIYGPGCRFVIWVQGCSLHCKGCWNKEMWSFQKKNEQSVEQLMLLIKAHQHLIEGITLLGGEPLDQLEESISLLEECKKLDLTTMVFSGYEMDEIVNSTKRTVIDCCDILITGRYDKTKRTLDHQWIGSTNQEVHFLTQHYQEFDVSDANYVEISIDDFGKIDAYGFPSNDLRKNIVQS